MNKKIFKKRSGATLTLVLLLSVLLSFLVIGMYIILDSNTHAIVNDAVSKTMFYHAKTGIEIAENALYSNDRKIYDALKNGVISTDIDDAGELVTQFSDTVDKTEINTLPNNISIDIKIAYITEEVAAAHGMQDKANMFVLESTVKNTATNKTRRLRKYIDAFNINWYYE